jgi:hypothetical protein
MSASDAAPLPRLGEVFFDVRGSSRSMRLSWYADTGVAVFSIWQGGMCTGTFRLPIGDLPRMIEILQRGPDGRGSGRSRPDQQDWVAGEREPAYSGQRELSAAGILYPDADGRYPDEPRTGYGRADAAETSAIGYGRDDLARARPDSYPRADIAAEPGPGYGRDEYEGQGGEPRRRHGRDDYPESAGGGFGRDDYREPAGGGYGRDDYREPAGGGFGRDDYREPAGGRDDYREPAGGGYGRDDYGEPSSGSYGRDDPAPAYGRGEAGTNPYPGYRQQGLPAADPGGYGRDDRGDSAAGEYDQERFVPPYVRGAGRDYVNDNPGPGQEATGGSRRAAYRGDLPTGDLPAGPSEPDDYLDGPWPPAGHSDGPQYRLPDPEGRPTAGAGRHSAGRRAGYRPPSAGEAR